MRPKFLAIFFSLLLVPMAGNASMSGGVYEIYADSIGVSGVQVATSTNFSMFGTIGESMASTTAGTTYNLTGGFISASRGFLNFSLSDSSMSLGTLSESSVSTDNTTATVSTDAMNGYTLSLSSDGNLRTGSNDIDNVSDGSVTAGSEEYGVSTSGPSAAFGNDRSTSSNLVVAQAYGIVASDATVVTFKASVGQQTLAGTYTQAIIFTVTANP